MDFWYYNLLFFTFLILTFLALYSNNKTIAGFAGAGILILGLFLLLSPLEIIVGEVINYGL